MTRRLTWNHLWAKREIGGRDFFPHQYMKIRQDSGEQNHFMLLKMLRDWAEATTISGSDQTEFERWWRFIQKNYPMAPRDPPPSYRPRLEPATSYPGLRHDSDWNCQASEVSDDWLTAITGASPGTSRRDLCGELQRLIGDDFLCIICSGDALDGQQLAVLPCGHLSHWDELEEYAEDSHECPECGNPFRL